MAMAEAPLMPFLAPAALGTCGRLVSATLTVMMEVLLT